MTEITPTLSPTASRLARWTLAAFVLTFLLARIVVLLIMTRRMPDLFLHLGQTHVHHLNYGIFLLAVVGAWLLFVPPRGRGRARAAVLYGIGLALTFDEFGMWLHLGGSYWQRVSYDAIVTLGALLGLLSVAPALMHFRARDCALTAAIVAAMGLFAVLATEHLHKASADLEQIERDSPQ